jgi:large subunit ribosomal protein L10
VIIAKNTLLRMAARETGHEVLEPLFVGPTAITFAYDDIAKTAKAVEEYLKSAKIYTMRGGILGSTLIKPDEIEQVAKMPSRQEVLGQIVSGIQAPVAGLVGVVNAPASGVVGCVNSVVSNVLNVLQARINQLESQGQAS